MYPRVTEIIKMLTQYQEVPTTILNEAKERGTYVHEIAEAIVRGDWVSDNLIPIKYFGYIASFRKYYEGIKGTFDVIEERYADLERGFSGKVDYVLRDGDKNYLIDLKTTYKYSKSHYVQMAAYRHLLQLHGIEIESCRLVYLDKNGNSPELHYLMDTKKEWRIFEHCLECYRYMNPTQDDL